MSQLQIAFEADLEAQDVRMTMGGEPTYVGIDEPESAEWNIDALGEIKRSRGLALIRIFARRWRQVGFCITARETGIRVSLCLGGP